MFCPNCGTNAGDAHFCSNCGTMLKPKQQDSTQNIPSDLCPNCGANLEYGLCLYCGTGKSTILEDKTITIEGFCNIAIASRCIVNNESITILTNTTAGPSIINLGEITAIGVKSAPLIGFGELQIETKTKLIKKFTFTKKQNQYFEEMLSYLSDLPHIEFTTIEEFEKRGKEVEEPVVDQSATAYPPYQPSHHPPHPPYHDPHHHKPSKPKQHQSQLRQPPNNKQNAEISRPKPPQQQNQNQIKGNVGSKTNNPPKMNVGSIINNAPKNLNNGQKSNKPPAPRYLPPLDLQNTTKKKPKK